MVKRRCDYVRKPELGFWKPDGKLWYAEKEDLQAAVSACGRTIEDVKSRMGLGFHHIEDAMNGKRLDSFAVSHVEWGIASEVRAK